MGFKSYAVDPEVWLKPVTIVDGNEYYEYILMYVDDILSVSGTPLPIMKEIQEMVKFKNDNFKEPMKYVRARLYNKNINGFYFWSNTSVDYEKAVLENVENGSKIMIWKLPN